MCDPYILASSRIHHAFRGALSGPISSSMGMPIYCFLKHFSCTISTPFFQRDDVFYLLCTRASMVLLLRNTHRRLWHLEWYICLSVCVYVVNGITAPCLTKNCTPRSVESGFSHPGRIWIDAPWSRACRRGRPRSLIWSVRTHHRRLPTVVVSEQFVSVWATGRNSHLFVWREYPLVSTKRMRHALPAWPPWVSPCTTRSMVRMMMIAFIITLGEIM